MIKKLPLFFILSTFLNAQDSPWDVPETAEMPQGDAFVSPPPIDSDIFRELYGKIEELSHKVQSLEQQLNKKIQDDELRFSDLEKNSSSRGKSNSHSSAKEDTKSSPTAADANKTKSPEAMSNIKTTRVLSGSPESNYDMAFSYLKQKQYQDAIEGFSGFIDRYAGHDLVPNSYYWLGESYLQKGDVKNAEATFAQGFQKFPKSSKAYDMLFKLGVALMGQASKKAEARVVFEEVVKKGPAKLKKLAQEMAAKLGTAAPAKAKATPKK